MKVTLENGNTFETIDTDNVVRSSTTNIFICKKTTKVVCCFLNVLFMVLTKDINLRLGFELCI